MFGNVTALVGLHVTGVVEDSVAEPNPQPRNPAPKLNPPSRKHNGQGSRETLFGGWVCLEVWFVLTIGQTQPPKSMPILPNLQTRGRERRCRETGRRNRAPRRGGPLLPAAPQVCV